MRNSRRNGIDRSDIDDDESTPPTLAEVDAALYGKLARVDGTRRAIERTRFGAFKITPKGLEIGEGAQQKDWEEAGQFIFQVESGIQWLIGDWLAYGDQVGWGETSILADQLGRKTKTLIEYAYVARNVQLSIRMDNLSFGHHQLVAPLPHDEQVSALVYANEHGLSVAAFRKLLHPESDIPALPPQLRFKAIGREMDKFMDRDPSTAKPDEKATALRYAAQMRTWLEAYEKKWG